MDLKKRPNWTLSAAAAAAVTVGLGGAAVAASGNSDGRTMPGSITLRDTVPVASATVSPLLRDAGYEVIPGRLYYADDSRIASLTASIASVSAAGDTATGTASPGNSVTNSVDSPAVQATPSGTTGAGAAATVNSISNSIDSPDVAPAPATTTAPMSTATTGPAADTWSPSLDSPDVQPASTGTVAPATAPVGSPDSPWSYDSPSFDSPDSST